MKSQGDLYGEGCKEEYRENAYIEKLQTPFPSYLKSVEEAVWNET